MILTGQRPPDRPLNNGTTFPIEAICYPFSPAVLFSDHHGGHVCYAALWRFWGIWSRQWAFRGMRRLVSFRCCFLLYAERLKSRTWLFWGYSKAILLGQSLYNYNLCTDVSALSPSWMYQAREGRALLGTTNSVNGTVNFGPTDPTGQSGPPPEVVPNIPVWPNRNGRDLSIWLPTEISEIFGLMGSTPCRLCCETDKVLGAIRTCFVHVLWDFSGFARTKVFYFLQWRRWEKLTS